jgi:hypothetical protein
MLGAPLVEVPPVRVVGAAGRGGLGRLYIFDSRLGRLIEGVAGRQDRQAGLACGGQRGQDLGWQDLRFRVYDGATPFREAPTGSMARWPGWMGRPSRNG